MENNNELFKTFDTQKSLFHQTIFNNLYSIFQQDSFKVISSKLAEKFVNDIFRRNNQIEQLFRLWLTLTPITDNIAGVFKVNYTKNDFIDLLVYLTSQDIKYYHLQEIPFEIFDINKLIEGLELLKIKDKNFIDKTIEIYKAFYSSDNALGRFAKTIFNKVLFAKFIKEQDINNFKFIQRYNTILKLSKTPFLDSQDITKQSVKIWDYRFLRYTPKKEKRKKKKNRNTKLMITLSGETSKKFKESLMACTTENQLERVYRIFLKRHGYIFHINDQFFSIDQNSFSQATYLDLESVFRKDYQDIDQDTFLYVYYNPYKEM